MAGCLKAGVENFRLNGMEGEFVQAFVSATSSTDSAESRTLSVDDLVREKAIDRVHILHSDIQGAELDMLIGARETIAAGRVNYVFLSTHTQQLHAECLAKLAEYGFTVIAEADLDDTYSQDGVIVARAAHVQGPPSVQISKRTHPSPDGG